MRDGPGIGRQLRSAPEHRELALHAPAAPGQAADLGRHRLHPGVIIIHRVGQQTVVGAGQFAQSHRNGLGTQVSVGGGSGLPIGR